MSYQALFIMIFYTSFLTTLLGTIIIMRKLQFLREKKAGEAILFFGKDMAKNGDIVIPTMGGLAITFGVTFSILLSLRFVDKTYVVTILAGLITILIIAMIGLLDDIFIIRKTWRIILPGIAALPLIAVNSGNKEMNLTGYNIQLGDFYTFALIPLGVIVCANLINILAGFNGLEAGCGAVACASIFISSLILLKIEPQKYSIVAPIIMLAMLSGCLAFLLFNWYPAKIFPGNIGTYVIGGSIASAIIIGNIEKIGVIALIPQIFEFMLKLRGDFNNGNFGMLVNGRLVYNGRICSLTHILMKYAKVNEKRLVAYLLGIQTIFGLLAIWSVFWYR